ncbi:hypothetical protein IWQ61_002957 [Dispira simplex]|nr:hypothetical protein IWQ61_002957 [Dispira simplex]
MRRSGLQLDVLHFYRECLRAITKKPQVSQPRFRAFVRHEFTKYNLSPRDVQATEFLLRRGRRQLETYRNPSIMDVHNWT